MGEEHRRLDPRVSAPRNHKVINLPLLLGVLRDVRIPRSRYLHFNWWDEYVGIGSVNASKNGTQIGFGKGWPGVDHLNVPSLLPLPGNRWYALNLLSELDLEGEYYIDRGEGILYFMPPSDIHGSDDVMSGVFVSKEPNAVRMTGTAYVTLSNLGKCASNPHHDLIYAGFSDRFLVIAAVAHSRLTCINATAVQHVWVRECGKYTSSPHHNFPGMCLTHCLRFNSK